jgi:ABC-type histidine transport system ATPase subunit
VTGEAKSRSASLGSEGGRSALLSVYDVVKKFGPAHAVDGVSLDFYPQEVVDIVGDNGAGKSTFLSLLTGFHHPDSGRFVTQALDAEPARKATLHRGFRQYRGDKPERQRHPNRALALIFAHGERLDGLGRVDEKFVEAAASVAQGPDETVSRFRSHGS